MRVLERVVERVPPLLKPFCKLGLRGWNEWNECFAYSPAGGPAHTGHEEPLPFSPEPSKESFHSFHSFHPCSQLGL